MGCFLDITIEAGGCIFAVRRTNANANNGKTEAYAEYTPLRTALYGEHALVTSH